jgi:hypothetical protein
MMQSGAWECKKLREEMTDPWDVTIVPAFRNDPVRTLGELTGTAMFASTQHPEGVLGVSQVDVRPSRHDPSGQCRARSCRPSAALRTRAFGCPEGHSRRNISSVTDNAAAAAVTLHLTPDYFSQRSRTSVRGIAIRRRDRSRAIRVEELHSNLQDQGLASELAFTLEQRESTRLVPVLSCAG